MNYLWLLLVVCALVERTNGAMCPGSKVDDAARQAVVERHNTYRSNVALGKAKDKDGNNVPTASNMLALEYSCELEASAQIVADVCSKPFQHSTNRVNVGENMAGNQEATAVGAFKMASDQWYDELPNYKGVYGHYTQMVWDYTSKIGCGFAKCGTLNYIICHYAAAGNDPGVYNIGAGKAYTEGAPCTCDAPHAKDRGCKSQKSGLCLYSGITSVSDWSEGKCEDHPLVGCNAFRKRKWCSAGVSGSCPKSVSPSGWCPVNAYCRKSCTNCTNSSQN